MTETNKPGIQKRTHLLDDVCRCNDRECKLNDKCARYIFRKTGRVHTQSLRNKDGSCSEFVDILIVTKD